MNLIHLLNKKKENEFYLQKINSTLFSESIFRDIGNDGDIGFQFKNYCRKHSNINSKNYDQMYNLTNINKQHENELINNLDDW